MYNGVAHPSSPVGGSNKSASPEVPIRKEIPNMTDVFERINGDELIVNQLGHDREIDWSKEQIAERARDLKYAWFLEQWPIERVFARTRDLSRDRDFLPIAQERGLMLLYYRAFHGLFLVDSDYKTYDIGIKKSQASIYKKLVTHPRMYRGDWEFPRSAYAAYMCLTHPVSEKLFEILIGKRPWRGRTFVYVNWHTTQQKLRPLIEKVKIWERSERKSKVVGMRVSRVNSTSDDFIVHAGGALEVLATLPADSIHTCVTSPPYFEQRDFGSELGHEKTPEELIEKLVVIFRSVRRVLRPDGTLWLNMGDTYTDRNLCGIPWRLAFALQDDGWILRSDIIWHKPSIMPESVKDRCSDAHEYIFMLAKSERYFFDAEAISVPCQKPGRTRLTKSKERAASQGRRDGGNWTTDGDTEQAFSMDHSTFQIPRRSPRDVPGRACAKLHLGGNEQIRMLPGLLRADDRERTDMQAHGESDTLPGARSVFGRGYHWCSSDSFGSGLRGHRDQSRIRCGVAPTVDGPSGKALEHFLADLGSAFWRLALREWRGRLGRARFLLCCHRNKNPMRSSDCSVCVVIESVSVGIRWKPFRVNSMGWGPLVSRRMPKIRFRF